MFSGVLLRHGEVTDGLWNRYSAVVEDATTDGEGQPEECRTILIRYCCSTIGHACDPTKSGING